MAARRILLGASVFTQVPIPSRYDGFVIGEPSAPVVLEVYFDLVCSGELYKANLLGKLVYFTYFFADCQEVWPIMKDVMKYYGPQKIKFIMHSFPLPYHRNAFLTHQV